MMVHDYLSDFRSGVRDKLTTGLAMKRDEVTTEELVDVLLSTDNLGKLTYRRAYRHANAPKWLTKKLAKDGEFLHNKVYVFDWDDATPEELLAGAEYESANGNGNFMASLYTENPNADEKLLTFLYRNHEGYPYLWDALMLKKELPEHISSAIENKLTSESKRMLKRHAEKLAEMLEEV
jgi:hypothetical protein